MNNKIFKLNALIAVSYTVFFVAISFMFDRTGRAVILGIVYAFVACIHFMAMGVLMAINHFRSLIGERNGYMASFAFIWVLLLLVQVSQFYIR
ncbi:MAG: hypothetical protein JWR02_1566 [Mucilaginibacter sp.]|nr:hypothetical protein [Mucilaginibacter sp.]